MTARMVCILALFSLVVSAAQNEDSTRGIDRVPNLDARLAALAPDDPNAYFLLAEDVSAEADDADALQLARTLYVLAFETERAMGVDRPLAPSVCLALADMARLEQDKRWLVSLAHTLDRRYATPVWRSAEPSATSPELALQAATVLGLIRSGNTNIARRMIEDQALVDLLVRYESLLAPFGDPDAFDRLLRQAEQWPCNECDNERITWKQSTDGPTPRVCYTCLGNPGPRLSSAELIGHLRLESALLGGENVSWSAQIATDLGAPLRDPDPNELAPTFGIDPTLVLWRDGAWVATPARTGEQR